MEGAGAARKRSRPETANGSAAGGKRSKGEASLSLPQVPSAVRLDFLVLLDVGCPRPLREVLRRLDLRVSCESEARRCSGWSFDYACYMRAVCAMRCASGVFVTGD